MSKGKFSLFTAIAYASGKPHIGNLYEIVMADAISRFKRATGYDVYFQTGTDEHGQKIAIKAQEQGINPQEYVDQVAGEIRRLFDLMGASYDRFVRTTDPHHIAVVQKIFKRLYEQGDIYKGAYEGHYCVPCESFFTQSQLLDGKCPDCGREVKLASEEAYFFKLSKYTDRLIGHIEQNPEFIQPESRKNEMLNNFLIPGLQDLCVSRTSFSWGVPVDFDPGHVVYVWIDALSNYITFLDYEPAGESGALYQKYWPADVHLIGKDILRFHTIYWPILLMALDIPLPKQIFGHPWLLMGEGKMSKSKGNILYPDDLVELFSLDAVRYYVLHEMPFANDGTITFELLIERQNSDLANVLGNLVNRTLVMLHKYCGGVISPPQEEAPIDEELRSLCLLLPDACEKKMDTLHVADAISEVFTVLRRANKYIDETMPWVLGKDESQRGRLNTVLFNLCEAIRICTTCLAPFLPETAARIFAQLNLPHPSWDSLKTFGAIASGHKVGEPEILFARLDSDKKLAEIAAFYEAKGGEAPGASSPALKAAPKAEKNAPKKAAKGEEKPEGIAMIGIEDFQKVELRVAKITACEEVADAQKLYKIQLDLGGEQRQICSGIRAYYTPEQLIGRQIILVSNLKPAVLRGVESCGMLLAADAGKDGVKVIFCDDAPVGAKVR